MGLFLLLPGLVFLLNGTEWFSGEDNVGVLLTVVGAVILLLQIAWMVFVAARIRKTHDEVRKQFDINDFRR